MTFFDFVDQVPTRFGSYWPRVSPARARPRSIALAVDAIMVLPSGFKVRRAFEGRSWWSESADDKRAEPSGVAAPQTIKLFVDRAIATWDASNCPSARKGLPYYNNENLLNSDHYLPELHIEAGRGRCDVQGPEETLICAASLAFSACSCFSLQ